MSVDRVNSRMVVHDEQSDRDVVVILNNQSALSASSSQLSDLKDAKPGAYISIVDSITASKVTVEEPATTSSTSDGFHHSRFSGCVILLPAATFDSALLTFLARNLPRCQCRPG